MSGVLQQYFYTVQLGDTVFEIARRRGLPVGSLIAANNLSPPYTIWVGQQLSIPPGVNRHRVKAGESVYEISQQYGVPMALIIEANSLQPPYLIHPDQVIKVPRGIPYYIVQPGDTLFLIARKYNVIRSGHSQPELIRQVNQLPSFNIFPGMRLIIPYSPPGATGLVAFTSKDNGTYNIWAYDPSNGVEVQLTDGLANVFTVPFWSPDSSQIAFVGKNRIIYVLHLKSGEIAEIDQLLEGEGHMLAWSNDSQKIAYTKQNRIILYNLNKHQAQSISEAGATDVQWFPDGNELLYQAPDINGMSQLFRIRLDGTSKQQVTNNQQGRLNHVRLSPNGRFALYTTPGVSISIIHTVDLSTGQVIEVRGGPEAKNYFPIWAPDFSMIAYSATAYPERGYFSLVRTVRNTGEEDRTWNISDCFATPVSWSSDSRKIVYLSGCQEQSFASEMWYFDLNHPVPIQLIKRRMITSLSWSPTPITLPKRTFVNPLYKVKFEYPINWVEVSPERYEGVDGFFQISAVSAGPNINEVCENEAYHQLMPYGTQPRIFHTIIQNQEACFIFPSFDQPIEMNRQAALIVRYPVPIQISDVTYHYFILWASNEQIVHIANTLAFIS